MENLTEKLNTFTALVMKDAAARRDEILASVEHERNEKLTAKEDEFLTEAYEEIQKSVSEARKHSNEKVLHEELEAKKKILLKREEIIAKIMEEAADKLKEFTKSEAYGEWLVKRIEKAVSEVGKGKKTVYISAEDMKYKEKIEAADSSITVAESDERGFLGGARVYNADRKVAADYSFKELLAEQKSEFLQNSGLTIN